MSKRSFCGLPPLPPFGQAGQEITVAHDFQSFFYSSVCGQV